MDERRRLQDMARVLARQPAGGPTPQIFIQHGDEPVARGEIACAPGMEQARDVCVANPLQMVLSVPRILPIVS